MNAKNTINKKNCCTTLKDKGRCLIYGSVDVVQTFPSPDSLPSVNGQRRPRVRWSGRMKVMKLYAIKREGEENESDGWEGNEAEETRVEDSCNYAAEIKTKHARKKC